jgi:hypothetical protein
VSSEAKTSGSAAEATATAIVEPPERKDEVTSTRFSVGTEPRGDDEGKTQSMPKYAPPPAPVSQSSEEVGKTVVVSPVTQTVLARAVDAATSPSVDDTVQVKKSDIPAGSDPTQTTFIPHKTIDDIKKGEDLRKSQATNKRTRAVAKAPGGAPERRAVTQPETSNQALPPARMNLRKLALLGTGAGLAVALFLAGIAKMFPAGDAETEVATKEFSSPIPAVTSDDYLFPQLPSGLYVGSLSGLLPGKKVPLTLISLRDRKEVTVVLGVEGWSPVTTTIKDAAPKGDAAGTLRTNGNGYIIDLTAQTVYGELYGTFRNLVNGAQGEWRARPVKAKPAAQDSDSKPTSESAPQAQASGPAK